MDDPAFNARLMRMFAEAPVMGDAELFAADVERRLSRGWALRRSLILALGGLGGGFAAAQTFGSSLPARLEEAPKILAAAREALGQLPLASRAAALDLPLGGEAMWLVVGLAALAAALLASRGLERF